MSTSTSSTQSSSNRATTSRVSTTSNSQNKILTYSTIGKSTSDPRERYLGNKPYKPRSRPRPENWSYNNDYIRTTHFDERRLSTGESAAVPRVVTIVWQHNRDTGVTRFAAVQWTQHHSGDEFDKGTQRNYALLRFQSNPITVRLLPIPQSNYEVSSCLRWAVYDLGVSSNSRAYKKYVSTKRNKSRANSQKRNQQGSTRPVDPVSAILESCVEDGVREVVSKVRQVLRHALQETAKEVVREVGETSSE